MVSRGEGGSLTPTPLPPLLRPPAVAPRSQKESFQSIILFLLRRRVEESDKR